ncbi:hypothetical protein [Vibrio phage VCPH]|nr:hypothetical protein [Vibrio phage VCPH]
MIKVTDGSEDLFLGMVSSYILDADNQGVHVEDLEIEFVYENARYRENLVVTGMNWSLGDAVANLEIHCRRVAEPDVKFSLDQHGLWSKS